MASWRIDDLDGGLASDLLNLSGLGNEFPDGAYNMRYVHNKSSSAVQKHGNLFDVHSRTYKMNRLPFLRCCFFLISCG